tara:strand:+ start:229 stop:396 length:168 start_codon:yes stop_codon:yes gene_type:complete
MDIDYWEMKAEVWIENQIKTGANRNAERIIKKASKSDMGCISNVNNMATINNSKS